MNEILSLAVCLVAGIFLGVFFYGGLWWTVRQAVVSKQPALLFSASLLIRMVIVVTGFYFVLGNDWKRLIAGLTGFVIARLIVLRATHGIERAGKLVTEINHAP